MKLYPNPVSDELFIETTLNLAGTITFWVYNALGQLQLSSSPENRPPGRQSFRLPVQNLPAGVYIVELVSTGRQTRWQEEQGLRAVFLKR